MENKKLSTARANLAHSQKLVEELNPKVETPAEAAAPDPTETPN